MNCSVCNKNPAVAKCSVCGNVICKTCGALCPSCKKPICRSHLVRLSDGMFACHLCSVPKQKAKGVPINTVQQPVQTSVPKHEKVSLSFEDLASEFGDIKIKISEEREEDVGIGARKDLSGNAPSDVAERETVENPFALSVETLQKEEPAPAGYKHLKRKPSDDPNEFRILTASSPKPTPMWVSGIVSALLAITLSFPLLKTSFPSLFAYSIILLAGGSVFWNSYGFYQSEKTPFSSVMYITGIVMSIIAIGISILYGLR